MDIRNFFGPALGEKLHGKALNPSGPSSATQINAARELNKLQESMEKPKTYQKHPEDVKKAVGEHAFKYGVKSGMSFGKKNYPDYEFKRETVRNWRFKYQKKQNVDPTSIPFSRAGRPSLLSETLTTEIKVILENLRISGCAITRKVVIAVGNGVLASKCPDKMSRNGGSIELSIKWARNILKSMNWTRRRGTTAKRKMNPALYDELCFTWKRNIAEIVLEHKIDKSLILNFDQTPLGYTSPAKVTFTEFRASSVPIANLDDKRQITGTFTVSLNGEFLPIQLIYAGTTDNCHPKVSFPPGFDVTHSPKHWSNEDLVMSHLKKIVFPHLKKKKEELGLPMAAKSLLIFDVFRGQTTPKVLNVSERKSLYDGIRAQQPY